MENIFFLLRFFKKINANTWYFLSVPLLILMILILLILPLPTFILDVFFIFNIVTSIIILIVSMFLKKNLDFSSFPAVLLFSTLLRLSLNIASTRIILLNGHTGSFSAGRVIESFGFFLIKGNFFIGFIIFCILIIINFLVITKGSGRIAEVSARFILDALPGKQMAIDADLNAGIISEKEATRRRINVHREADFYGSMDGASKFVRGDAIAGIIIMTINIIGGFVIGMLQHGMSFSEAIKTYGALTIGDGLVAQIPSLMISIASGVILTQTSSDKNNISGEIVNQIFNNYQVIFSSGIIFFIFGVIPGMPNFIFLFFSVILFILSGYLYKRDFINKLSNSMVYIEEKKLSNFSWNDIHFEYLSTLELSPVFLKSMYQDKHSYLLKNLYILRKDISQDFGFLISKIHITYNPELKNGQYRFLIKGVELGSGDIFLDKILVLGNQQTFIKITGIKVIEPFFCSEAFWIDEDIKEKVIKKKLTIINSSSIIIAHVNNIIRNRLFELFGFQETQQLLERVSQSFPKLVDYLIPNIISLTTLQMVLQNLLKDGIPIKDIRTILETLIKHGNSFKDNIDQLTSITRMELKDFITQKFFLKNKHIYAIGLSSKIESILLKLVSDKDNQLEPIFSEKLIEQTKKTILLQEKDNLPLVLVTHPQLRILLSKLFSKSISNLTVLSFLEISEDCVIKITYFVGMNLDS
ncbi:flagellar biosynthesis protein FlhA [Buchnera aphidicola]|uniref:Flagellar biosynthesis protein FlhA n=1 Tax=Buchnera aphidicola (Cinara strobi) TaxID=1921549 RepID=A0A3B1E0G5_9GAMM|nr:Flagellar biosynthesis protein FlhA [Buchnera aphidicola (Cinara strobi)]